MSNFLILITSIISVILSIFILIQVMDAISKSNITLSTLATSKKVILATTFILGIICWIFEIILIICKDTEIIIFFILAPLVLFSILNISVSGICKMKKK